MMQILYFLALFGDVILPTRSVAELIFNTVSTFFVLAVQYLLNNSIWTLVFIKLDHKFVACIFSRLLPSILKMPYLLHEHPMALLAPANHLRM